MVIIFLYNCCKACDNPIFLSTIDQDTRLIMVGIDRPADRQRTQPAHTSFSKLHLLGGKGPPDISPATASSLLTKLKTIFISPFDNWDKILTWLM